MQTQWGGARPGSGRPRKDPITKHKPVGISVHPGLIKWIEDNRGFNSRSAFVSKLLEIIKEEWEYHDRKTNSPLL